ncbi:hypothetical protein EIN_523470 [Entamoeba invadens IP1]|uniref:Uncharacterized protein n=1 Tax=Entamoeba invadens IP1 TaxID=370355 RepID=A0A0A1UBG3_ENTIV|nr:hypothetical protein EIN_523470 [Entamoeba invadens IP1]ELP92459.1 hypothetical protein EIN_523470 [Entamoeba invadens IP1]|eukprot:XP_004259230.1 hypothetical protein EIN_523470 [Entamoeba invadens IP1]
MTALFLITVFVITFDVVKGMNPGDKSTKDEEGAKGTTDKDVVDDKELIERMKSEGFAETPTTSPRRKQLQVPSSFESTEDGYVMTYAVLEDFIYLEKISHLFVSSLHNLMNRMKRRYIVYGLDKWVLIERIKQIEEQMSEFAYNIVGKQRIKEDTLKTFLDFFINTYNINELSNPYRLYIDSISFINFKLKVSLHIPQVSRKNYRLQSALQLKYFRSHRDLLNNLLQMPELKNNQLIIKAQETITRFLTYYENVVLNLGFTEEELLKAVLRPFKTRMKKTPPVRISRWVRGVLRNDPTVLASQSLRARRSSSYDNSHTELESARRKSI